MKHKLISVVFVTAIIVLMLSGVYLYRLPERSSDNSYRSSWTSEGYRHSMQDSPIRNVYAHEDYQVYTNKTYNINATGPNNWEERRNKIKEVGNYLIS